MANEKETRVRQAERKVRGWLPGWSIVRRIARVVLGVVLIILGLLALFTPLTPGSWLALVGLEFLGLRVLLRNRLCAWAAARPESRFRKAVCRIVRLDGLEAVKRRWQRRREARSSRARPSAPPVEPQRDESRSMEAPPCEAPPVEAYVRHKSNP